MIESWRSDKRLRFPICGDVLRGSHGRRIVLVEGRRVVCLLEPGHEYPDHLGRPPGSFVDGYWRWRWIGDPEHLAR